MQREYECAFHRFKPDKHLKWLQHLGTVTVRLELADRIIQVEATPLQTSISECFEERDVWSVPDLGLKLGIDDEDVIVNALNWWTVHGILRGNGGTWTLMETATGQVLPAIGELHATYIGEALTETLSAPVVVNEEPGIERLDEDKAEAIRVHWPVRQYNNLSIVR